MCHLSCLGCSPDDHRQSWSPPSKEITAINNIPHNYKICPRCRRSSTNSHICLHCGTQLRWDTLPSLPDLNLFAKNRPKPTQAGHPVAPPPEGRWRKWRATIAARLSPSSDSDGSPTEYSAIERFRVRNIMRSCGNCNNQVNYADICNRFCPECGWALSLTSTALDRYADVVRAGPHQQGRRRIRSMLFNRSARARQWELGRIEERSERISEEGVGAELAMRDQYPDLSPQSMPSTSSLAFITRSPPFNGSTESSPCGRLTSQRTSPPEQWSTPISNPNISSGETTLVDPHAQPPSTKSYQPQAPATSFQQPGLRRKDTFFIDHAAKHHRAHDQAKTKPTKNDVFSSSKTGTATSFDFRVIQSLIESLNVDPMAVAAAAVQLYRASSTAPKKHHRPRSVSEGSPLQKFCGKGVDVRDQSVVALRRDGGNITAHDAAGAIDAGNVPKAISASTALQPFQYPRRFSVMTEGKAGEERPRSLYFGLNDGEYEPTTWV